MGENKIIILAQQVELGGVEKAIIMLANSLCDKGYKVEIFSVLNSDCIIPLNKKVNLHFLSSNTIKKENKLQRVGRKIYELYLVKKLVNKLEYEIVISTRNEYNVLLSKHGQHNFCIAMLHNEYTKREMYNFKYDYKNINYFVQLNDTMQDEIREIMKNNHFTKIITIPNFINKRKVGHVQRENIVISVGGMRWVKGFDRLVEIWKLVAEENPEWKLHIIGTGEEALNIEKLVSKYKLEDSIELTGYIDNEKVLDLMGHSKIYALPSRLEAFGFVIIEAMQNGLPVVSFDVRTGPANIIENEKDGYLIPDNDVETFACKLRELMNNKTLLNEMSQKAINKSEKYETDKVIKEWMSIIEEGKELLTKERGNRI